MNYLEFAKHLSQLFQAKFQIFRFNILATGTVSANGNSRTGRAFAFSITGVSGLTILASPKTARSSTVETITLYISDSYTGQVGIARVANVDEIETAISLQMLNFTGAATQFIGGNIQSVVESVIASIQKNDAVAVQAEIQTLSTLTATLVKIGGYVEFEIADITGLTAFVAALSALNGQELTLDLDAIGSTVIVGSTTTGEITAFNIGGQGSITITALLYKYATLGDYENTTLATMENESLGDLEMIQIT